MNVEKFTLDRSRARELFKEYRKHQHYSEPIDREIQRVYQLIAQGRMVIRAIESIKTAGVDANGCPKLALIRADAKECYFTRTRNGAGAFVMRNGWGSARRTRERILLPSGTLPEGPEIGQWQAAQAIVPLIPLHIRPKRAMANYHILWEAEWTRMVPRDPFLLRRIGKGDMWLVLAAWDLTDVERAALASRLAS